MDWWWKPLLADPRGGAAWRNEFSSNSRHLFSFLLVLLSGGFSPSFYAVAL